MRLRPDLPIGSPPFNLSEAQIATVVDLASRGAHEAIADVKAGMLEVPITLIVRKAMRQVKKSLGLTNLEIRGEHEIDDMATHDPTILGRIDLSLKFLHQFGDEDAYVAIECKRVGAGLHQLNERYVTTGVNRFATGQYAAGHQLGFMLGYVLALPVEMPVKSIDRRIRKTYGAAAKLTNATPHALALAVLVGSLVQAGGPHSISLMHLFVDMTKAAQPT
jgi:hypothetical protein